MTLQRYRRCDAGQRFRSRKIAILRDIRFLLGISSWGRLIRACRFPSSPPIRRCTMNVLKGVLCGAVCLMAGCVVGPSVQYRVVETRPGLSMEEIVRMSKAGLSDAVLIEKIKAEGVAARPSSDQLASLKQEGLSDQVLAVIVTAPVQPGKTEVYPVSYYYGPAWYGSYWYGWPYYWGGYYPYYGWYYPRYSYYGYRVYP